MNIATTILATSNPLDHVVQHELFTLTRIGSVDITIANHTLMILVAGILMAVTFYFVGKQRTIVPTGLRNFFESICVYLREDLARPFLGDATDRFIPLIWNTFFFILFVNLLGMIPIDGFGFGLYSHIGGTATANIWVTGALAAMAFVMIHVSGIREQGIWKYIVTFIPHVPWPLIPLMYVLEIAGAIIKPCALAIRLFANMVAGHTILAALVGLGIASGNLLIGGVVVAGCALFSLLELLVAVIQAYIFTFLMTMFIGAAMHPDH